MITQVLVYFAPVSVAQITKKHTHPQLLELQQAVVCCRRAVITRKEQHSTQSLKPHVCTGIYVCTAAVYLYFRCSSLYCNISVLFMCIFRKVHPYCRSERDIPRKRTTQHRAISSAQVALGIIKSLVAPNHGPLLSAPFTFFIAPAARGAEPLQYIPPRRLYTVVVFTRTRTIKYVATGKAPVTLERKVYATTELASLEGRQPARTLHVLEVDGYRGRVNNARYIRGTKRFLGHFVSA